MAVVINTRKMRYTGDAMVCVMQHTCLLRSLDSGEHLLLITVSRAGCLEREQDLFPDAGL